MKWKFGIFFPLLLVSFLLVRNVFASGVVINEIAWMGSSPKDGETSSAAANNEWIELKNTDITSVNLDGWSLSAQDGTPSFTLTGSIPAGGFFLFERSDDDTVSGITSDIIYTGALSNSGEKLILQDEQGTIIDMIDATSEWPAGSVETKETMQKGEGWITAPATPRAENIASESPLPSSVLSTTPISSSGSYSSSSPVPSSIPLIKSIKAYAGEDRSAMVGTHLEFLGHAQGIGDEPINDAARFFWNFGDGETQEGRSVTHMYRMPGIYTAGTHISSGAYTASDYIRVNIIPNLVSISDVVLGTDGYMRLANASDIDADISGWSMRDAKGNTFVIPPRTLVGMHATIALPNNVTGLLKESEALPVGMLYPNGVSAFIYNGTRIVSGVEKQEEPKPSASLFPVAAENVEKQEKKKDPAIIAESKSSSVPDPTPDSSDSDTVRESQATASVSPWVSTPLVMAIVVSMFGAIGFLVLKQYL